MPKKFDDFDKIDTLRHSLDVIEKEIKKLNTQSDLTASGCEKRKSLPRLKESKKEIEEELANLESNFLDYLDKISDNPRYSFLDELSKQVLVCHYCEGKNWTDSISEVKLVQSVRNFKRDICNKIIIADYLQQKN